METFLNCVWLLVGLSLIALWLTHALSTPSSASSRLLPSCRLQLTALFLLVLLLFPVISLTDDLAMCTAPRDAERALRLHDPFDGSQPPASLLPSTLAWMDALADVVRDRRSQPLELKSQWVPLLDGSRQPIDSRPPPAL